MNHLFEVLFEVLSLPFASRKARTENERMQFVFAVAFLVVLLLGVGYGALLYLSGPR